MPALLKSNSNNLIVLCWKCLLKWAWKWMVSRLKWMIRWQMRFSEDKMKTTLKPWTLRRVVQPAAKFTLTPWRGFNALHNLYGLKSEWKYNTIWQNYDVLHKNDYSFIRSLIKNKDIATIFLWALNGEGYIPVLWHRSDIPCW